MFKYAQIDETGRCVSVSFLSGEVVADNMILLSDTDDVSPQDTYDAATGIWTPNPQPTPLDAKQVKINELNTACNTEILSGYISSALGTANTYDFDYEAQTNLGGMLNAITAGIVTTEPISWKASGVPTAHTFAQFKTLFADGLAHKNTLIQKYWTLKTQVNTATTQAEIDAIVW